MNGVDEKIKEYIEKYSIKHHITFEEAENHALVKEVIEYYKEEAGVKKS